MSFESTAEGRAGADGTDRRRNHGRRHGFLGGGTKQDSRAERAKKKFVPHFSKCGGYKQANISRGLLNILKFAVWLSH